MVIAADLEIEAEDQITQAGGQHQLLHVPPGKKTGDVGQGQGHDAQKDQSIATLSGGDGYQAKEAEKGYCDQIEKNGDAANLFCFLGGQARIMAADKVFHGELVAGGGFSKAT